MNENTLHFLIKFYDILYDNIERNKKLDHKSVLISLLKIKTLTPRQKILRESSKSSSDIPTDVLKILLSEKLVQSGDEIDKYTITSKGIFTVEKEKEILNEDSLMSFIDSEYFIIGEKIKPITDREKVILFGMIAARTLSKDSLIDLRQDNSQDTWMQIFDMSYEKLKSLNIIKEAKDELLGNSKTEHNVVNLIRHNIYLTRKIKGYYHTTNKMQYYLDISDGDQISRQKLSYLFWQIFQGNLAKDSIDDIMTFCKKISNMGIYVFNMNTHIFSMPKYDLVLEDCIKDSIISKRKWEKM
jgi:hypothetical protein